MLYIDLRILSVFLYELKIHSVTAERITMAIKVNLRYF